MRTFLVTIAAAAAVVSGCRSDAPEAVTPPDVFVAFPNLTMPPGGRLVSRGGGADAVELTIHSPGSLESVAGYFREYLSRNPWRLVSDAKSGDGGVVLYGESDKRPIWVRLRAIDGGVETVMTGGVPGYDTTFARKAADTRDTTNTLGPR